MTPVDKVLDHSLLTKESPLTLYRLTSHKYATDLSGLGAALYPGRWNLPGEVAIYTSTQIGTCVLERLVHTPKNRIPTDLALMTIHLKGNWAWMPLKRIGRIGADPLTGGGWIILPTLNEENRFMAKRTVDAVEDGLPTVLAIPSVIVPVWNVVLYPRGRAFWDHVSLVDVEPFDYDPRLFPDETPVQL